MFEHLKTVELQKAEARLQMFKAKVKEALENADANAAKMWYLNLLDEEKYIEYINKI
jgi:hypothetical protein